MEQERTPGRRGDGTRAALLAAAGELLEEGGMGAVTLRAVGERAGVSRQAPYRHFADKEALLSVLAAGYFRRLRDAVDEAAAAGEGALARLDAMSLAYVRFALDSPRRYRLMFGPEMRASLHPEVHEGARALGERYVRTIAVGQQAGEIAGDDPLEVASLLYAVSHGAVDLALAGHLQKAGSMDNPHGLIRGLLALLSAGATPGAPRGSAP